MSKLVAIVCENPIASTALLIARFASRTAQGSMAAISAARLKVRSCSVPSGTTSLTMPHSRACSAERGRSEEDLFRPSWAELPRVGKELDSWHAHEAHRIGELRV